MTFTEAFAQESIKQIDEYFKKESKEIVSQLRNSLAAVKVINPEQQKQAVRVLQCVLEHLKTSPLEGQFNSILRLLSIHTAPDSEQLKSMLRRAIELDDAEAIKLLVAIYGLDINAPQDSEGNTLFFYAISKGSLETVRYFLEPQFKVDINYCTEKRETALFLAIRGGFSDKTRLLLENGADIALRDQNEYTALHLAAGYGLVDICKLLVNHKSISGASEKNSYICARSNMKFIPLHNAAEWGHTNVVEYFIECGVDINTCDGENRTALHWAIIRGHVETINFLLANGADVAVQDKNGSTALHFASEKPYLNICKILMAHQPKPGGKSADPTAKNKFKLMPIHFAAWEGRTEIVDYFLYLGVDKFVRGGKKNETILHLAARFGHEAIVVNLLEKKLDPADLSKDGTALHSAVIGGQLKICRLLIDRKPQGLNPLVVNKNGLLPIHLLPQVKDSNARLEIAKYFIEECKIDVNVCVESTGYTPLHFAAKFGATDLIAYYIRQGAKISVLAKDSNTALDLAVQEGEVEAAELLLQARAQLNGLYFDPDDDEEYDEEVPPIVLQFPIFYGEKRFFSYHHILENLSGNPARFILKNFSVNHEITVAIWNIAHKIAFSTLNDRNLSIIPDLQNIIVEYAKLDPSDVETLKLMGLDQKSVIEMAEEVLLSYANLLGKVEEIFLNSLAAEIFEVVPDPSKCKIYWEKLKGQFEKNPKGLDLVQRPSKLDKNQFPSKSETKEREEKHVPTITRPNELEQPFVSSELQSAQRLSLPDVKREKTKENSISTSIPKSNAFDLDADAIMLPPSMSPVTSSSTSSSTQVLVATTKSCLDEWFWQLPIMNGSATKSPKKKGEKRKLEEKQESDLESHKQSKNESSSDASILQTTSSFFSTPSNPNKRKSEKEHESDNGKKVKCESSSNIAELG